ncbi:choice-of-anchor H family protein [Shewanella insulae]|uniref:choice-of-anchor H family protein n=1 Tax=Shewanella insulae TaxID=2681496 RepID=UPI001EFC8DE2|nr:choice-of-anchor H family protein [Shewanella insulae]MCG9738629.1 choice-of-anchor H family protein [Shewanella insulae]
MNRLTMKTSQHLVTKMPSTEMSSTKTASALGKLYSAIKATALLTMLSSGSALAADNLGENTDLVGSASTSVVQDEQTLAQGFSRAGQSMTGSQQASAELLKQQEVKLAPRKTREQVIAERQALTLSAEQGSEIGTKTLKSSAQRLEAGIYHEFAIYEASSRLFEDVDYDGFYRTFSVTFDADVHSYYLGEHADVYADLYLSRNGGPWELYHTTDVFTIVDDASDDDFEVLTTLHTGYPTDHYDVLIDLYEVGYSDIVATISSDDLDDLYGLPLESADRDQYVVEEVVTEVEVSGGSLSVGWLFGLLGLGWLSLIRRRQQG